MKEQKLTFFLKKGYWICRGHDIEICNEKFKEYFNVFGEKTISIYFSEKKKRGYFLAELGLENLTLPDFGEKTIMLWWFSARNIKKIFGDKFYFTIYLGDV